MSGPANIDSWLEFIIWAILSTAVLIGAVGGIGSLLHAWRSSSVPEAVQEVKEQVKNSHSTNLRDDVDRTAAKVDVIDAKVNQSTTKLDTVDTKVDRLTGVVDAIRQTQVEFMREIRAQMARQDRIAARHHPDEA